MARNDIVLVDSLLRSRSASDPNAGSGELFELFVIEQVMKNHDLSREEIEAGWIDGTHDGGIDAFYILVNGRPLTDPVDFTWPRSGAEIEVYIFTCKHHDTFLQAPLDAILATVQEIFDLSKGNSDFVGKYSPELRERRDAFAAAFDQLSLYRPTISFHVVYGSRGDTSVLGESVSARGAQIAKLLESYFSASTASFVPLGAAELVDLHRQVKSFALDLPVQECLTAGNEGYVVLCRLVDYCGFVRDGNGELRRYLFDSNVRAFLGQNLVNKDIASTLGDPAAPNFWWLNNGVTILATNASLVGKTLKLRDIQIVNGLQTTESIHKNLPASAEDRSDKRALLIKVIVSADDRTRDQVIRATNNQTAVEGTALHATDRIQQDIEEILLRNDWYYERRTNYYRNEGRPESRIVSPLLLATGSVALLSKNPAASSKLKQKATREPAAYEQIFSRHFPLQAWPVVAALVRAAENAIFRSNKSGRGSPWRGPLAYIAAVRLLGTFSYSLQDFSKIAVGQISDSLLDECLSVVLNAVGGMGKKKITESKMGRINVAALDTWKVQGHPGEGKRALPLQWHGRRADRANISESDEFLAAVSRELPDQPWKPGVHRVVAATLKVSSARVSHAIQLLIRRGDWREQRDGVVYDRNGVEVLRDTERAPERK